MSRLFSALLLLVPIALAARLIGISDLPVFIISALAIVPLAKILGDSTETLAGHYNPTAGAFLNATFGNAAELIISIAAISADLPKIVLASITGAILGNVLLVLGLSVIAGGIRHKEQTFRSFPSGLQASMLFIALTGLAVPTVFSIVSPRNVEFLSDTLALVLISVYALGLLFTFSTHRHLFTVVSQENHPSGWSVKRALSFLAGSVILVALMSELLVGAVVGTIQMLGVSQLFIGVVIIGIVGNVAEHFAAVQMALKNKVDVSIGIAAGSGAQIAIFVTPLLVLLSGLQGHQLTLTFTVFELVAMFAAAFILMIVSYDGKSNWFEGVQLLAVYVVLAAGFYFLPP